LALDRMTQAVRMCPSAGARPSASAESLLTTPEKYSKK
jgi:hypothetical protein